MTVNPKYYTNLEKRSTGSVTMESHGRYGSLRKTGLVQDKNCGLAWKCPRGNTVLRGKYTLQAQDGIQSASDGKLVIPLVGCTTGASQ